MSLFSRRRFLSALGHTALLAPLVRVRHAFGDTAFQSRYVVVMLFGGGTRYRESVEMAEGALLPNLFGTSLLGGGDPPPVRIDVGGPMGDPRMLQLPAPRATPLKDLGTLFTQVRYAAGEGGHTQGESSAVCGAYNDKGPRLDDRPVPPTLFEHLRKKKVLPATATWLVQLAPSNGAISYSRHPDFGPPYGASYLNPQPLLDNFALSAVLRRPLDVIRPATLPTLALDPAERDAGDRVRQLLDSDFPARPERLPAADASRVEQFIVGDLLATGYPQTRPLSSTSDAVSLYAAERILATFQPALTFVNAFEIDACHQNFNQYLNGIRVADAAVSMLWDAIQAIPEMAGRTTLFVLPEHGRDSYSNEKPADAFGRRPVDHGADAGPGGFRDVWCLALGPDLQAGKIIDTPIESVDVGATVAALSGVFDPYQDALRPLTALDPSMRGGRVLTELLR
jgi:hypothetical protein